jgi:lauroyl/myristoyl acyltransferase
MRDSLGIETLEIGQMLEASLRIRRLLADNRIVAMLLDRSLGRDRVDVSFFGRQTGFLRTPAMIGYLSRAPLLPAFMIRHADGRFSGSMGDPIVVNPTDSPEVSVRAATQAFATQLERQISANPHLWYQFYPYWGTNG